MQETQRLGFSLWIGKIPWCRKWQLSPIFLPGKLHGQRSFVGGSPWCLQELNTTEHCFRLTHRDTISPFSYHVLPAPSPNLLYLPVTNTFLSSCKLLDSISYCNPSIAIWCLWLSCRQRSFIFLSSWTIRKPFLSDVSLLPGYP